MHLRRNIYTPVRYDEEDLEGDGAKSTTPRFPKMLQDTVIPFNPNVRPAAFPSLDFNQDFGQTATPSHGSSYKNGILTLKIPSLRLVCGSSLQRDHFETSATVQGSAFNSPLRLSKPRVDNNHLKKHARGTSNTLGIQMTREPQVCWSMIDLPMQVYLYSDLIIQLSSPKAVADWLGLQMCDLEAVHRAYQIRKIYPASFGQLWDYCVSANNVSGAHFIDPELLPYFLDYFAFSIQHEFASKEQILLASAFLRQHHIDPSILEDLLGGGKYLINTTGLEGAYNYEVGQPKSRASRESFCSTSSDDRVLHCSPSSADINSDEIAGGATGSHQSKPSSYSQALGSEVCMSEGMERQILPLHFTSEYFPKDQHARLLEKPPHLLTSIEYWLKHGACHVAIPEDILRFQDTPYTSIRALVFLRSQYFSSLNDLAMTNESRNAYIEALGCLWLYIIRRGMAVTDLIWERVCGLPVMNIQRKAYQIVAGTLGRQSIRRVYDRMRLMFLDIFQNEANGNQELRKYDRELAVLSEAHRQVSNNSYPEGPSFAGNKSSKREIHPSAIQSKSPNLSERFEEIGQASCGAGITNVVDTLLQRSYAPTEVRTRSETLSTNDTLDMSGQSVRYRRVERSVEYESTASTNWPSVCEKKITLFDGIHENLNPTNSVDTQNDTLVSGIGELRNSEEPLSPVAPSFSPVSIGCGLNQISKDLELETKAQLATTSHHHSGLALDLRCQTPWKSNKRLVIDDDSLNKIHEQVTGDRGDQDKTESLSEDQSKIPKRLKLILNPEPTKDRYASEPPSKARDHLMSRRLSMTAPPEPMPQGRQKSREENYRLQTNNCTNPNVSDADSEDRAAAGISRVNHTQKKPKTPSTLVESVDTGSNLAYLKNSKDNHEESRKRKHVETSPHRSKSDPYPQAQTPVQPKTPRRDKGVKRGPYMTKKRKEEMKVANTAEHSRAQN